jgi:hypothetical protein
MGIICQHGQKEGMHNENLKRLNCCMFKGFRVMVFNTTFNNISVISWRSVLLMEETGVPGENHRSVASH